MKLLKNAGSFRILSIMAMSEHDMWTPLKLIEEAGRTAYQSRNKITDDSCERFVKMLRDRGHESVLEHSAMTVEFNNVSRGFTHELVRHRLMAITQESTRYVDESDFSVVVPPNQDASKPITLEIPIKKGEITTSVSISFEEWMQMNKRMYSSLRNIGWPTEDARQVLPIGIKSQIVITANFREWRHIFKMRTAKAAHWEIQRVMRNLLVEVKKKIPVIFDDINAKKEEE